MKNVVLYSHRVDNDGYASAAIMNLFFPDYIKYHENDNNVSIKNIPWTYGDDEPTFEDFIEYDYAIVVDLHFNNELTLKLRNHFGDKFIWVDHHAQCIIDYENYCDNLGFSSYVNGFQSKKTNKTHKICNSAAELCWYFLFGCPGTERFDAVKGTIPTLPIMSTNRLPNVISLISDFDVWNHESDNSWSDSVYPFQMGSKMEIKNYNDMMHFLAMCVYTDLPEYNPHDEYYFCQKYINAGKIIIDYENTECLKDIRSGSFFREFEYENRIYKACILNTTKRSSNVFVNMPNRDEYDVFICYNIIEKNNKPQYRYSMYAFKDDVNCAGMIINNIRFNGHAHACGAQADYFIF